MTNKCVGVKVLWVLLFVGGLNWGLVGAFDWNLVTALFGSVEWLERGVYILVGLAAIGSLMHCKCKACKVGSGKEKDGCCGS
ncbi:MAG: DUF378 domain-containing protein [Candidatus Magasanikbacteria bacterium]|nr:DUF378 domain-containing protein [Candidatus Magasanikbacteria bacterium]